MHRDGEKQDHDDHHLQLADDQSYPTTSSEPKSESELDQEQALDDSL